MSSEGVSKKSSRIATFDLLRGYFMVSIILDHLQWYPNGYGWVAMRGSLLVSAAEGFFLISGIVLGIVRGRKLLDKPFRVAAKLLLHRGVVLYLTSVVLMLAFTMIGWWFFMDTPGLKAGIRPIDQPFMEVLWGALSFKYIYGWADFLRLYSVFILISPLALWLIRKGKWYIVTIASIALWSIYPWALEHTTSSSETLMILSWQIIFFAGLIIGYYWQPLSEKWYQLKQQTRRLILTPLLTIAAATLVLNIVTRIIMIAGVSPDVFRDFYSGIAPMFVKDELPIPRLVVFGLWFTLGFYIMHRFEKPIKRFFGWILLPFGQNSLYVYIMHAVLLFFAHLIMQPESATFSSVIVNFLGSSLILGIIYLAVRKEFLFKIIPR